MRRIGGKTRRMLAGILTAAMIMTMVSQDIISVSASEPNVTEEGISEQSGADDAKRSEAEEPDSGENGQGESSVEEIQPEITDEQPVEGNAGNGEPAGMPEDGSGLKNPDEEPGDQEAEPGESPDTDTQERPGGEENSGSEENLDAEQGAGTEQNPDVVENLDSVPLPEEEESTVTETVSGSDLNEVTADQEAVSTLGDDQGWIEGYGDYYWSVLDGKLYVSGSGNFTDATHPDAPWLAYAGDIKTAEIHMTGMTSTARMFSGCKNLESVVFKTFDTDDVIYMSEMFSGCSSLTSIDLRKFRTGKVELMSGMFNGCSSLEKIDLSGFDFSSVTNTSSMFRGCGSLTNLDFSSSRAENPVYMQYMFFGCDNLQSVDLSGFYTDRVTNLMDMFSGCRSLESINWGSHFKTEAVTNIQGMFTGCSSLASLDLSGFDLKGITNDKNVRYFLSGCYNLDIIHTPYNIDSAISIALPRAQDTWYDEYGVTHTELPHVKGASVTLVRMELNQSDIASGFVKGIRWRIDSEGRLTVSGSGDFSSSSDLDRAPWFPYADKIKSASVDVTGMTDASFMFFGCSNMSSVDLSRFDTDSVTNMESIFADCGALTGLDLSRFDTRNVTNMSGMFQQCSNLKSLDLRHFDTGKVTNMDVMFWGCSSLTSLDLSGFDTSKVTCMGGGEAGMFGYCENLVSLDLSGFDTRNVEGELSWMFVDCKKLQNLDMGTFDLRNIYSISGMFSGCESLEQFDLSVFVNYNGVWDTSWMFADCKSLKRLNTGGFDAGYISHMPEMFQNCSSLTGLSLRRTGVAEDCISDMNGMFAGCGSLTNLDLRSFETKGTTDMSGMFRGCGRLAQLNVDSFDTAAVSDMSEMFAGCSSLTSLDLSGFDAKSIREKEDVYFPSYGMKKMFEGCTNLAVLRTPCNVPAALQEPAGLPGGTWYRTNATETTELPSLEYSITLTKKKPASSKPPVDKASLKVKKSKTDYLCGEAVNLDDLAVTYYATDGTVRKVTDYTTNVGALDISVPGKKKLVVTYDELTAEVELNFTYEIKSGTTTITVPDMVYTSVSRMPVPTVRMTVGGKNVVLAYGRDFKTTYANNVNAGENTAKITVTGINNYSGTISADFTIRKAALTIRPLDMTLAVGDSLPESSDFAYRVTGLYVGDALLKEPSFVCDATQEDMSTAGKRFEIRYVPDSADAGSNYEIGGMPGMLTISQERVSYTVTFDYAGHKTEDGTSTEKVLSYIKSGSLITEPEKPVDNGYVFAGWYKDRACTKAWNFDTDTVQEDLTLYACWLLDAAVQPEYGEDLCIKEIKNQEYTGKPIKPTIIVYSGDAAEPLKAGRDYTIKYCNNVEADTENERNLGGISSSEELEDKEKGFNKDLAYVVITGKGNYIGTACRNFHIDPAPVADGDGALAKGFHLKYTEQLTVNAKKEQKPFGTLKYKKAMKAGKDFDVRLTAIEAYDEAGDVVEADRATLGGQAGNTNIPGIPAGWHGSFLLTVTGKGNYCGTLTRTVWVTDKSRLMKNVSVSLGKNLKNIEYNGKDITLIPAWYDTARKKYYEVDKEGSIIRRRTYAAADVFTVKCGKEYLCYGKDFSVSYTNNRDVGTATMHINGEGDYMGTKSVTFKIKGTAFNTKNVKIDEKSFADSLPYTGQALTQNGVVLRNTEDDEKLVYGRDYFINYKNNKKKGTATMIFTAKTASGYTGSFKKSFKIVPADLKTVAKVSPYGVTVPDTLIALDDGNYRMKNVSYQAGGAKLSGRFLLTDTANGGAVLREGVDYTLSYSNNKKITASGEDAVMTVRGKGNYTGDIKVYYGVETAQWGPDANSNLQISVSPIAYDEKKTDTYVYVPKVKITDGRTVLKAARDYTLEAHNCTQSEVSAYLKALADLQAGTPSVTEEQVRMMRPYVFAAATEGSGYDANSGFRLDVDFYMSKLNQNNLYVVISEDPMQTTYTKWQVKPDVTVYYGDAAAVKEAKRNKITEESELINPTGQYGLTKLKYAADKTGDYTIAYGNNVAAGKNKGSVTVNGTGLYGGSVTVKFTILRRDVYKIIAN